MSSELSSQLRFYQGDRIRILVKVLVCPRRWGLPNFRRRGVRVPLHGRSWWGCILPHCGAMGTRWSPVLSDRGALMPGWGHHCGAMGPRRSSIFPRCGARANRFRELRFSCVGRRCAARVASAAQLSSSVGNRVEWLFVLVEVE
jgi:hypothetical protein